MTQVQTLNPQIAQAYERITGLPSPADKRRFLRALRYSVLGDGNQPPQVFSPREIEEKTGIAIHVQYEFGIVVSKSRALRFLEGLGYTPPSQSFRKKLNRELYKKKFGKGSPSTYRNKLIFSYLEVMFIERLNMEVGVPGLDETNSGN